MARLTIRPTRGRPRRPRVQPTNAFLEHLRGSGAAGWQLALLGGWRHYSFLSAQLHQRDIPAAAVTLARFYQLADALNFPRADVFRVSR